MTKSSSQERAQSLSFRQLRLFEAIGDLKSVRRASEACSLSQPAVTQALAKMEVQLGATLVDRRASGSYLNEYGLVFHARVKRFFEQTERAIIEIGAAINGEAARAMTNRLSRSQLRTLVGVMEHGSFEQASDSFDISAASLQRAARDLQGNLHVSLFYRTAAGMLVSPQGMKLGLLVKLALQEIELGVMEVDSALDGSTTPVVIGAMPFGGTVLLASVLDRFLERHPCADVRITNEGAVEMYKCLRAGDVDFVVGLLPEETPAELVCEPLVATPYAVVARQGHPLARAGKVTIEELMAYDWITGTPGSSRRACFDRIFEGTHGPQTHVATCALPVIRHLLKGSDRLTLMTSYELTHEEGLRTLHCSPIEPVPAIGITTRADWLPTPVQSDFIEVIRAHANAPVPKLRKAG
ncbi:MULTISPECIES: LysR family transcriptional regulator [Novosphingobium]|jgi:DNA-binding transcriptional LysR family regulator|uniref:LysR family transcriptional regulator n=1 Tax=Novosphingobium TaxID=165696 RepID=UPI0022F28910|nr:LysR family transcriptional regulator [Novosphingobium resinovorum]GLK43907.1 transcriptional regulator [Novosphingobium resinovorum]